MEQRNYTRLKAKLDAQFITQNSKKYDCVIIDFCIHGMRLSIPNTNSLSEETDIRAGQKLIIQFTANWNNQSRLFQVIGITAQISEHEIGLKIPSFQPEAFQAIRSNNAHIPVNTNSTNDGKNIQNVMSESLNHLQKMIDIATNKLFERIDIRLNIAHDESMSITDQGTYRYASKFIKSNKHKIHNDLVLAVKKRVLRNDTPYLEDNKKITVSSLSLVSHSEMDDWIHASSVATQLNEKFQRELSEMGQRIADFVNQPLNDKDNPFSPSALMESLRESLQSNIKNIENENEIRNFFYEEFGNVLRTDYAYFIQDIDRTIPALSRKSIKHKKSKAADIQENDAETENKLESIKSNQDESINNLLAFNKVMQALDTSHDTTINSENDNHNKSTTILGFNNQNLFIGLMQRLSQLGKSLVGETNPIINQNKQSIPAPKKDIKDAIDRLDTQLSTEIPLPLSKRIEDEINANSNELRLMTDKEREALDTVSLLYDKAIPSTSKPTSITELTKQLEAPLLKAALSDESIVQTRNHPARNVVNLVEQFSIATDSNGSMLDSIIQKNLDDVVEKIKNDFESGGSAYLETAKQTLERLLDPLQKDRLKRISEFQEIAEKNAHTRDAHRKIKEYLEARFAGHEVAELIEQLLREGWESYLLMIILRDGMHGTGWSQGEIALERLMTWSEATFKPNTKHRFEVSAWLAMVERHLTTICEDLDRVKIFMALAKKSLEQTLPPTSRPLHKIYIPEHYFLPLDSIDNKLQEQYTFLIDRLKIGEWWEFLKGGNWMPMQLIWMSHPPGLCLFTNRSATEQLEVNLEEFNLKLNSNLIREGEDLNLPMLERAEYAVVDDVIRKIKHQATHSHIQGIWNRNGFMLNLTNVSRDRRRYDQTHVLMVIGFDQIGMIYTQRGMEAGDHLIQSIAEKFITQLRKEDVLAIFTECSFALLFLNVDQPYTQGVADKIMNQFKNFSFTHRDETYSLGINIGLVSYVPSITSPEEGIRRADAAYNAATKSGRNTMQWYDNTNLAFEEQQSLAKWAGQIDRMFQNNRFFLRCQMIIPLNNSVAFMPRYEILLGIHSDNSENSETIHPSEFIPILERLRRIHEIDLWVLAEFFDWASDNEKIFDSIDSFSINISALSLSNLDILNFLHDQFVLQRNIATKLFFEITETVAIEGYNAAQKFIDQMRHYGCRFSIDDFGSGHSSYTHLKNLNTNELKIDGFFVKDIAQSSQDYAMVKSMNEIAHSLGMHTVAEHVDSIDAIKCLRDIGVDYAQGYYLHAPMPLENLTAPVRSDH
jgi:diguanylate cyclase (GGDEF)-like protein